MECNGCGKKILQKDMVQTFEGVAGVFQHRPCGAVLGTCYKGESYKIVLPYWDTEPEPEAQYFDLTVLGSDGISRRHGWRNPVTKKLLQTG